MTIKTFRFLYPDRRGNLCWNCRYIAKCGDIMILRARRGECKSFELEVPGKESHDFYERKGRWEAVRDYNNALSEAHQRLNKMVKSK